MSALTEYTLEIYKSDKRTKEGKRLIAKQDFAPSTKDYINAVTLNIILSHFSQSLWLFTTIVTAPISK